MVIRQGSDPEESESRVNVADTILDIAQQLADQTPGFYEIKGPGTGDQATHAFMRQLRARVSEVLGFDCSEKRLCGQTAFAADFYVGTEGTIIEVAFSLRNSMSEYEKDLLKALMAKESGFPVTKLMFISKPGALKRHSSPGSRALREWMQRNHQISVVIHELSPTP